MSRHDALRATWAPGQYWETAAGGYDVWVPVGDRGRAEPLWDEHQEYRRRPELEQPAADASAEGRDSVTNAPADDGMNDHLRGMLASGMECPLCGGREQHQHTATEILCYRRGVAYGQTLGRDPAPHREAALRECWLKINRHVIRGDLPGNGTDKTAERNGLILATNIVAEMMQGLTPLDDADGGPT